MNKVQKLRFKRLIKMLENVKTELKKTRIPDDGPITDFNMATFGSTGTPRIATCGTAACALGTAACHPYFNAHGLQSKWVKETETFYVRENPEDHGGYKDIPVFRMDKIRIGNSRWSENFTRVGARFFGITETEAESLFCSYDTDLKDVKPRSVVAKAKKILDAHRYDEE